MGTSSEIPFSKKMLQSQFLVDENVVGLGGLGVTFQAGISVCSALLSMLLV